VNSDRMLFGAIYRVTEVSQPGYEVRHGGILTQLDGRWIHEAACHRTAGLVWYALLRADIWQELPVLHCKETTT